MENLSKKSSRAVIWSAFERIATQGIQFVVMLYLARMLGPQAFGTIGMISIILSLGQILSDGGLSIALLRKKEATDDDYNSAFIFNLLTSVSIWLIIFLIAPLISGFYQAPELKNIIRILSLNIVISALSLSHRTILASKIEFKKISIISIISIIFGSGIALIVLQFQHNAWVLVAQQISTSLATFILCNFFVTWRPNFHFKKSSLMDLWHTSKNIVGAGLLDVSFSNLYNIAIGKNLTAQDLGHFTQANQLTLTPSSTLSFIINRVAFSTLSTVQDEPLRFSKIFEKFLTISLLTIFPLVFLLILNAEGLVNLILGKSWNSISPLICILGLGYLIYPFHLLNVSAIQIKGETKLFLKLEIIKKIIATIIFLITFSTGVTAMCVGITIGSYICIFVNSFYSKRILALTQKHQINILMKALAMNALPVIGFLSLGSTNIILVDIALRSFVFIVIYSIVIYFLYKDLMRELWDIFFKQFVHNLSSKN